MRARRLLPLGALAGVLLAAACSKDKAIDQPAKLTAFNATLKVQHLWSASVDDKKAVPLRLGLGISGDGQRIYAAGHKGELAAFDLRTGHLQWRTRLKAPLAGGTAVAGELVTVGASDGQFFAVQAGNGQLRWKVRLNGEVLAPAALSERLIAVRTVDGRLHALSPADGHELWLQEQQVPRLSLRGTGQPVIAGELVLCGFDNGKVIAVNANDGSLQWEATVTPPHGRTELERLADIDSVVLVDAANVYAVGFQGRIAMLALDTGQVWWSHEASSYRGMTLEDGTLYLATADGDVVALKARTGTELWRQSALAHRRLSSLASMGDAVVVGDFQGYLHWLDKASGALAARVGTGRARISSAPVVVGDLVVVNNDRGQISAYRVSARGGAAPKPADPAPAQ